MGVVREYLKLFFRRPCPGHPFNLVAGVTGRCSRVDAPLYERDESNPMRFEPPCRASTC